MEKKRLEFSGEVDVDAWGGSQHICDVSPVIGGENVVKRLNEVFGARWGADKPNVTVYLGVEPLKTGPLWAVHGFGGTDVTPPEGAEIEVGDFDLIGKLRDLDEREVVLVIESAD
jgi:hypothetical protein